MQNPVWQARIVAGVIVVVVALLAWAIPTIGIVASKANDAHSTADSLCKRAVSLAPQQNLLRQEFKSFVDSDADFRKKESELWLTIFEDFGTKAQHTPIGRTVLAIARLNASYEALWRDEAAKIRPFPAPTCGDT